MKKLMTILVIPIILIIGILICKFSFFYKPMKMDSLINNVQKQESDKQMVQKKSFFNLGKVQITDKINNGTKIEKNNSANLNNKDENINNQKNVKNSSNINISNNNKLTNNNNLPKDRNSTKDNNFTNNSNLGNDNKNTNFNNNLMNNNAHKFNDFRSPMNINNEILIKEKEIKKLEKIGILVDRNFLPLNGKKLGEMAARKTHEKYKIIKKYIVGPKALPFVPFNKEKNNINNNGNLDIEKNFNPNKN